MSALNLLFKAFLPLQLAWASEAVGAGSNTSVSMLRELYSFKEVYAVIDLQNETLPHNKHSLDVFMSVCSSRYIGCECSVNAYDCVCTKEMFSRFNSL